MTVSKKEKAVISEIEGIKLDDVTEEQIIELLYPKRKAFAVNYKHKATKITCSCCGHEWHAFAPQEQLECPNCHKPIEIEFVGATKQQWESDYWLACIKYEAHGEYQFVRFFVGMLCGIIGKPEHIVRTYETHRFVYDKNGKIWFFRRDVKGAFYSWWFSQWSDIKYHTYAIGDRYMTSCRYWLCYSAVFPNPTYTERFRYCRAHLVDVGSYLENWLEPFAKGEADKCRFLETVAQLDKGVDTTMRIRSHSLHQDFTWLYENSRLILKGLSMGYDIANHEWYDNVRDLKKLGLLNREDLIFPTDMDKTREKVCRMVDKRDRELRMRQIEEEEKRMLPKALEYQPKYEEQHKRFFEVQVEGSGLIIKPLKTVQAFYDEGMEMSHCVFRCEYFKRPDLQIYSVRDAVTGERIETLSLDIEKREIQQCYGRHDTKSRRHGDIIALVNANMDALLPKGRRSQA